MSEYTRLVTEEYEKVNREYDEATERVQKLLAQWIQWHNLRNACEALDRQIEPDEEEGGA